MSMLTESALAALGLTGMVPVGPAEYVALPEPNAAPMPLGDSALGPVILCGNRLTVGERPVILSDILTDEAAQMRGAARETLTAWLLMRVAPALYSR